MKKVKKKTRRIDDIIIVLLFSFAIYQTSLLWFFDARTEAPFSVSSSILNNSSEVFKLTEPFDFGEFVLGEGNGKYYVIYSEKEKEKYYDTFNDCVTAIFKGAEKVQNIKFNEKEILSNQIILNKFPFSVTIEDYLASLSIPKTNLTNLLGSFDILAVSLSENVSSNEGLILYLINSKSGDCSKISYYDQAVASAVSFILKSYENINISDIEYLSANESGFNIFGNFVFVPQWIAERNTFNTLKIEKKEQIDEDIKSFFDGQMYKTVEEDSNGTRKYSNEDVIVKYYKNNILEFYNYKQNSGVSDQTFATAYGVCKNFLEKDVLLDEKYTFDRVSMSAEGITFYFNYTFNDIPVVFSEDVLSRYNLKSPIEVVVSDNTVKRYRRYVCDFSYNTEDVYKVSTDFLMAVEEALEKENKKVQFSDIKIAYLADEAKCDLKWFLNSDERSYVSNLGSKDISDEEVTDSGE